MTRIAYEITDIHFHEPFQVFYSHNGWWMDREKLTSLIYGLKRGYKIKVACDYAGISLDQYKYFSKVHHEFSTVKRICESLLAITAKERLAEDIVVNPQTRRWYLERIEPETYGRPSSKRKAPASQSDF